MTCVDAVILHVRPLPPSALTLMQAKGGELYRSVSSSTQVLGTSFLGVHAIGCALGMDFYTRYYTILASPICLLLMPLFMPTLEQLAIDLWGRVREHCCCCCKTRCNKKKNKGKENGGTERHDQAGATAFNAVAAAAKADDDTLGSVQEESLEFDGDEEEENGVDSQRQYEEEEKDAVGEHSANINGSGIQLRLEDNDYDAPFQQKQHQRRSRGAGQPCRPTMERGMSAPLEYADHHHHHHHHHRHGTRPGSRGGVVKGTSLRSLRERQAPATAQAAAYVGHKMRKASLTRDEATSAGQGGDGDGGTGAGSADSGSGISVSGPAAAAASSAAAAAPESKDQGDLQPAPRDQAAGGGGSSSSRSTSSETRHIAALSKQAVRKRAAADRRDRRPPSLGRLQSSSSASSGTSISSGVSFQFSAGTRLGGVGRSPRAIVRRFRSVFVGDVESRDGFVEPPRTASHAEKAGFERRRRFERRTRKYLSSVVFLLHLVYQTLVFRALSIFHCSRGVGMTGTRYLYDDFSHQCDTPTHGVAQGFAAVAIVLYCFGIPFSALAILYFQAGLRATPEEQVANLDPHSGNNDHFYQRYGFMYDGYSLEDHRWWWEAVVMLRKLSIVGIATFIDKDQHVQLICSVLALTFWLALHLRYQPYGQRWKKKKKEKKEEEEEADEEAATLAAAAATTAGGNMDGLALGAVAAGGAAAARQRPGKKRVLSLQQLASLSAGSSAPATPTSALEAAARAAEGQQQDDVSSSPPLGSASASPSLSASARVARQSSRQHSLCARRCCGAGGGRGGSPSEEHELNDAWFLNHLETWSLSTLLVVQILSFYFLRTEQTEAAQQQRGSGGGGSVVGFDQCGQPILGGTVNSAIAAISGSAANGTSPVSSSLSSSSGLATSSSPSAAAATLDASNLAITILMFVLLGSLMLVYFVLIVFYKCIFPKDRGTDSIAKTLQRIDRYLLLARVRKSVIRRLSVGRHLHPHHNNDNNNNNNNDDFDDDDDVDQQPDRTAVGTTEIELIERAESAEFPAGPQGKGDSDDNDDVDNEGSAEEGKGDRAEDRMVVSRLAESKRSEGEFPIITRQEKEEEDERKQPVGGNASLTLNPAFGGGIDGQAMEDTEGTDLAQDEEDSVCSSDRSGSIASSSKAKNGNSAILAPSSAAAAALLGREEQGEIEV